ncbi:MAG: His/Gly/Thr/Pro-type tRNA ligase C-terminal domain-containing protein, partial [Candidatus Spechtbacteria bacterium]|nr:His/Gly/Thr/Pro-type tRNA ligase C-terminal domain-containing protein [Candidatus Spechtbacteria bacterium]
GKKELYGLAYRTDYDLRQHMENSGEDLSYTDPQTNEKLIPHVIEPSFGLERTLLAVLLESYKEEEVEGSMRVVAKFPRWMAPVKAAVFPLLSNDEKLVEKAKNISEQLSSHYLVRYDDGGAIGRRYRRHDEIGTPLCITVDHDTLKNDTVTVRDRDSMEQIRINAGDVKEVLDKYYEGADFSSLAK